MADLLASFTIPGYKYKFVCPKCKAVHWYRPSTGCQRCKNLIVERISTMPEEKKNEPQLRLEIDHLNLDKELQGHAQQVYVWGKLTADAQLEFDNAKSDLNLTNAELDNRIRTNKSEFDIKDDVKLTEQLVFTTIQTQPDYIAAQRRVNKARHSLSVLEAAVNALEHRKRTLSLYVDLWVKEYYTKDTFTGQISDEEKAAVRRRGVERMKEEEMKEDAERD